MGWVKRHICIQIRTLHLSLCSGQRAYVVPLLRLCLVRAEFPDLQDEVLWNAAWQHGVAVLHDGPRVRVRVRVMVMARARVRVRVRVSVRVRVTSSVLQPGRWPAL